MRVDGDHPQHGSFDVLTWWLAPRDLYVFDDALVEVPEVNWARIIFGVSYSRSKAAVAAESLSPAQRSTEMPAKIRRAKRIPLSEITSAELKERRFLQRPRITAHPAATLIVRSSTGTLLRRMVIGDFDVVASLLGPLLGSRFTGWESSGRDPWAAG
jgi:hypothetical protein